MTEGQIRNGTSVTAVQGGSAKLGQTPLIQVTVKGPERGEVARAADALANVLAVQLSSGRGARRSRSSTSSIGPDNACIKLVNEALAKSDLSTTEKILLQGRLQGCRATRRNDAAAVAAKNVEAPRVITHAGGREDVRAQPPQRHRRRRADRADPRRHRGARSGIPSRAGAPRAVDARLLHRPRVQRGGDDRRGARARRGARPRQADRRRRRRLDRRHAAPARGVGAAQRLPRDPAGEPRQGRGDPRGDPAPRRRHRGDPGRRHGVRPGRGARADRADPPRRRPTSSSARASRAAGRSARTSSGTSSATASSRC